MLSARYLRARRKEGFISVIAGFSFLGIMLGVATLIIVMAVMNGFRKELLGKILGLTLLYEIHDIGRFASAGQFLSYARLVRCMHESAGKKLGSGGKKIGNAHLKWAFSEAVCLLVRNYPAVKGWQAKKEKKHGKKKTLGILAAKLGRTVYHMLRKKEAFDARRFLGQ